jgi:glycosyltransferase involved in cell wall biosynthesis
MSSAKRTIHDRMISTGRGLYYGLTEPVRLGMARLRYERFYEARDPSPLISVYVPTYNRAQLLLERAVPSVLAQTYRHFELIIVGDCCTDATAELVGRIGDPRVRFFNLPKRDYRYPPTAENHWLAGPVVPANQALAMAQGKWIARIDDDDTWMPEHLETSLAFALDGGFEFVSAQYVEERGGQRRIVDGVHAASEYYTRVPGAVGEGSPRIGATQTWLYRSYLRFFRYNIDCWRKVWNRVNDIDLSIRMYKAGVRMGFLNRVTACVVPRPGETTVGIEAYRSTEQEKLEHFRFRCQAI